MKKNKLGNAPYSKYHHKTEAPGIPGHHRLSSIEKTPKCLTRKEMLNVSMMINDIRQEAFEAGLNQDHQAYRDLLLKQEKLSKILLTRCECPKK